jgi:hypothetical protein
MVVSQALNWVEAVVQDAVDMPCREAVLTKAPANEGEVIVGVVIFGEVCSTMGVPAVPVIPLVESEAELCATGDISDQILSPASK